MYCYKLRIVQSTVTLVLYYFVVFCMFVATPRLSPSVVNPVPDLRVEYGMYFEYKVPNNTFYDVQDGWTDALHLTLRYPSNQVAKAVIISDTAAFLGLWRQKILI